MPTVSNAYHTECMLFMPQFPDNFWNLGIPDPPYALKQTLKRAQSRGELAKTAITKEFHWDKEIPSPEYFTELKRVTVDQIIWGANYFPSICGTPFKAPRRSEYAEFIKANPRHWIIWDKVNGRNDFSDCELAWTSYPVDTQIFYFMWSGMLQGLSIQHGATMQGDKRLNEKRIHPTQKPLPLYQWELQTFAKPGFKLLDTHMGSQNSRIAAYKMGFDYWGTEISKIHYDDGSQRFLEQIHNPLFGK